MTFRPNPVLPTIAIMSVDKSCPISHCFKRHFKQVTYFRNYSSNTIVQGKQTGIVNLTVLAFCSVPSSFNPPPTDRIPTLIFAPASPSVNSVTGVVTFISTNCTHLSTGPPVYSNLPLSMRAPWKVAVISSSFSMILLRQMLSKPVSTLWVSIERALLPGRTRRVPPCFLRVAKRSLRRGYFFGFSLAESLRMTLCLIFTTAKFSSISVSVVVVLRLCPTTSAKRSPVR